MSSAPSTVTQADRPPATQSEEDAVRLWTTHACCHWLHSSRRRTATQHLVVSLRFYFTPPMQAPWASRQPWRLSSTRRQHNTMNTRRRRHRSEPVSVGALPPQPRLRSALCRVHADLLLAVVSTQAHGGVRADSFASSSSALTPDMAAIVENVR